MKPLSEFKESVCSCDSCKKMCLNPCIPTPQEATNLLNLGFADKLDSRYFWSYEAEDDIRVILPSRKSVSCVFLDSEFLCTLHEKGLKPLEGRLCLHGMARDNSPHEAILDLWQIGSPHVEEAFSLLEMLK